MPDNPHPHLPEFNQEVQITMIILYHLIKQRMAGFTQSTARSVTSEGSMKNQNNRYFTLQPRILP
jgi:hypothetical protein